MISYKIVKNYQERQLILWNVDYCIYHACIIGQPENKKLLYVVNKLGLRGGQDVVLMNFLQDLKKNKNNLFPELLQIVQTESSYFLVFEWMQILVQKCLKKQFDFLQKQEAIETCSVYQHFLKQLKRFIEFSEIQLNQNEIWMQQNYQLVILPQYNKSRGKFQVHNKNIVRAAAYALFHAHKFYDDVQPDLHQQSKKDFERFFQFGYAKNYPIDSILEYLLQIEYDDMNLEDNNFLLNNHIESDLKKLANDIRKAWKSNSEEIQQRKNSNQIIKKQQQCIEVDDTSSILSSIRENLLKSQSNNDNSRKNSLRESTVILKQRTPTQRFQYQLINYLSQFELMYDLLESFLSYYKFKTNMGIVAAYLISRTIVIRKIKLIDAIKSRKDIFDLGEESMLQLHIEKYINKIQKQLYRENPAEYLKKINFKTIQKQTFEILQSYLGEIKIDDRTEQLCFYYLYVISKKQQSKKNLHNLMLVICLVLLLHNNFEFVCDWRSIPREWDDNFIKEKRGLIQFMRLSVF